VTQWNGRRHEQLELELARYLLYASYPKAHNYMAKGVIDFNWVRVSEIIITFHATTKNLDRSRLRPSFIFKFFISLWLFEYWSGVPVLANDKFGPDSLYEQL